MVRISAKINIPLFILWLVQMAPKQPVNNRITQWKFNDDDDVIYWAITHVVLWALYMY